MFTYFERKSVVRDLKQVTSFLGFDSCIWGKKKGEISMEIRIKLKCSAQQWLVHGQAFTRGNYVTLTV